jgi:hypothetical protein
MSASQAFWNDLFAGHGGQARGLPIRMRLLKKRGQPFLLLPWQRRLATVSLSLYPAQTARARAAKAVLRWLLQAGLPAGTEEVLLTISPDDPFIKFLASAAGVSSPGMPEFGVLAGNPASEGQRFLVLVFDGSQRPVSVVKTGLSERARGLIQKEGAFLAALSGKATGIPGVRAEFQSPRLRALALDFFPGDSPRARDDGRIPPLLSSWVDPEKKIALEQTPDWVRLEQAASANDSFRAVAQRLRNRTVHAAIHHGDFAPWNIKVSPEGNWTVLDWERGELDGIPGWDWFHYVLQTAILVERLPTARLVVQIERLLDSEPFKRYAERAAISGLERWLVLAYLLHCSEVIKPSEGLAPTRELLDALCARWARF